MQSANSFVVPGDLVLGVGGSNAFLVYHMLSTPAYFSGVVGGFLGIGFATRDRLRSMKLEKIADQTRWGVPAVAPSHTVASKVSKKGAARAKPGHRPAQVVPETPIVRQKYSPLTAVTTVGRFSLYGNAIGIFVGVCALTAYDGGLIKPQQPWDAEGKADRVLRIRRNELVRTLDLFSWLGAGAGAGAAVFARSPLIAWGGTGLFVGTLTGALRFVGYTNGVDRMISIRFPFRKKNEEQE